MKKRLLLAKARTEWSYNIELWDDQMKCYKICISSDLPLHYAKYYLDNAARLRSAAAIAAAGFGDAAKRHPTLFDKLLLVGFGWLIKD